MNSFATYLRHSTLLTPDEIADFDIIQAVCNDFAAVTGGTARNIEQLMSLLDLLALSRPQYRFARTTTIESPLEASKLLKRALHGVYSPPPNVRGGTAFPLLWLSDQYDLAVVTTNYDMQIVATAASRQQVIKMAPRIAEAKRFVSGSDGDFCSIYAVPFKAAQQTPPSPFALYKLHGSVNWYTHGDDESLVVDDRWTVDHVVNNSRVSWHTSHLLNSHPDTAAYSPQIVAPTIMKTSLFEPFEQQWQLAAEAISTADILLFVGYSFPESDVFMRHFLSCALYQNSRLQRIVVIDPNPPVLSGQTTGMFAAPFLRDVLNIWPMAWEDGAHQLQMMVSGTYQPENDQAYMTRLENRARASALMTGNWLLPGQPQYVRGRGRW
jgi:hypothetical protein